MKKIGFSILAISALVLASCSGEDDGTTTRPTEDLTLSGNITEDRRLTADNTYTLDGALIIQSGATLTIDPGTTIEAIAGGTDVYILVNAGGRIVADGEANNPIRFTSKSQEPAAWGGLIINGNAIISGQTGSGDQAATEVNTGILFGGSDDDQDSGILDYVIIEYTGARIDGDAEHNGLTLNGVGSGTTLSNIWIANGDDDGIEFFGGSVNASNIFVLNARDDMFDFSQGYRGTCTNLIGIRENGFDIVTSDPRGIEADGNLDGNSPTDLNQSDFTVNGLTIINKAGIQLTDAIKIRRGATGTITNAVVQVENGGSFNDFIDLTDERGTATAETSINITAGTGVGTNVKNPVSATVTIEAGNTGADVAAFSWTGYSF